MAKFTIDFELTQRGQIEIEAASKADAKELFYVKAIAENTLRDEKYYPYDVGNYEITDVTEEEE